MLDTPQSPVSRDRTKTTSPNTFTSLPSEVLEHVYLSLDISARLALLRTCTALRDVYQASAQLAYDFTLQTTGYIDVPISALSPFIPPQTEEDEKPDPTNKSSRLNLEYSLSRVNLDLLPSAGVPLSATEKNKLLSDREKRWLTLDSACDSTFTIKGPAGVYELQEGIFLMCDDPSSSDGTKPTSIRLIPLPSVEDPRVENPSMKAKTQKMPFVIADLTMDPTQDLIVVSEYRPASNSSNAAPMHRFHLLSLTTFKPHPLATVAALDAAPFSGAPTHTRQLLQVMGDTLIILISSFQAHWLLGIGLFGGLGGPGLGGNVEEVVAWNWKTGKVLTRLSIPERKWFTSLALLTPTTFLVTSDSSSYMVDPPQDPTSPTSYHPVIEIYSFHPDPTDPDIPPHALQEMYLDSDSPRPTVVAQLYLPQLAEKATMTAFDVRPDPAFPRVTTPDTPRLGQGKAFTQDPYKGVVVFELQLLEAGARNGRSGYKFELFTLRETLVKMAREGEERMLQCWQDEVKGVKDAYKLVTQSFMWEDWGEQGARFHDISMYKRNWVCSCSGYRFVTIIPTGDMTSDGYTQEEEDSSTKCDIRILDFSPENFARDNIKIPPGHTLGHGPYDREGLEYDESGLLVRVVNETTGLEDENLLKDEVLSNLPYREITRRMDIEANGVMIDDQRVIVVCSKGRHGNWSNVTQDMTILCM